MTSKMATLAVSCDEFLDGSWMVFFPDGTSRHALSERHASDCIAEWTANQPGDIRVLIVTWNRMGNSVAGIVETDDDQPTNWFVRLVSSFFGRLFR